VRPSVVSAITRQELRVFRRDPTYLVITTALPLIVIPVLKSTVAVSLRAQGFENSTGAEQVVPGQAVIFSFFLVGGVAFSFFREHGWHTWDRLRGIIFAFGWVAYGLDLAAEPLGLLLVSLIYTFALVALGIALVALLGRIQQVNAISNLGAIVFGAIGGAFVGLSQLPGWVQPIAPATPTYWVMRSYRSVFLEGSGIEAVWLSAAMLAGFAALFATIALLRFRFDEAKLSWA
jgi:ABC-2 type transport system permease protein